VAERSTIAMKVDRKRQFGVLGPRFALWQCREPRFATAEFAARLAKGKVFTPGQSQQQPLRVVRFANEGAKGVEVASMGGGVGAGFNAVHVHRREGVGLTHTKGSPLASARAAG